MQLEEFLENSARTFPEKIALVSGGRRMTYCEIDRQCNRLAKRLRAQGVKRFDRVVIWTENSVETIVSIFAALKSGAAFVVLNPSTKPEKLTYIVKDSEAIAVVADAARFATVKDKFRESSVKVIVRSEDVLAGNGSADPVQKTAIDMDLAALIYTSGSTGRPKGVMLTHLNMI